MTPLRRKFLIVTLALGVLWAAFVLTQPDYYYPYGEKKLVFAFWPPVIWFLAGQIFVWAWQRYGAERWLKSPEHIRRGLLRLYLVVAVPWVAWFGFQILINGPSWRYLSRAFWSLLVVPVGAPIVFFVAAWVVAGFQKPKMNFEIPHSTPELDRQSGGPSATHSSPQEYYALISRAIGKLPINDYHSRQELYRRARELLHNQLREHERSYVKRERRSLDNAISIVEQKQRIEQKQRHQFDPRSTPLLVVSIFFLAKIWVLDFTSMSLYWVARLPKR
jgi:hypothetical protein